MEEVCTSASAAPVARRWTGKLDASGSLAAAGDDGAPAAAAVASSSSFCLK